MFLMYFKNIFNIFIQKLILFIIYRIQNHDKNTFHFHTFTLFIR